MLSEIQKTGLNTIFRICIFLLYYIALICIGAAILYGASFATRYIMSDVIDARPTDLSYKLLIIAGLIIMWVTVGLFGFYLIKPLFSFRSNKEHKTEVFRNECPELFAAIDDVAEKTGAKKPKHVYLSPGTNACVFFNRSFWSIFFPVRKNLEIGLGLFNSTSIVELKAIMAHEFGHFSQRSMRIVSSIYITNSIIAEMIDNDAWDNMIYKWRKSKWDLLCLTGNLVYWMTYYIQKLTFQMYKFVQKEYLKLSRNMEYNADRKSVV